MHLVPTCLHHSESYRIHNILIYTSTFTEKSKRAFVYQSSETKHVWLRLVSRDLYNFALSWKEFIRKPPESLAPDNVPLSFFLSQVVWQHGHAGIKPVIEQQCSRPEPSAPHLTATVCPVQASPPARGPSAASKVVIHHTLCNMPHAIHRSVQSTHQIQIVRSNCHFKFQFIWIF